MTEEIARTGRRGRPRAYVVATPADPHVAPGGRAEVALTVRNAGGADDAYRIAVVGLQRRWYTLGETRVAPAPGESVLVPLTLHPPADPVLVGARYPFRVQVTSETEPAIASASTIAALSISPMGADAHDRTVAPSPPLAPRTPAPAPRPAAGATPSPPRLLRDAPTTPRPPRDAPTTPGGEATPAAAAAESAASPPPDAAAPPSRAAMTPRPGRPTLSAGRAPHEQRPETEGAADDASSPGTATPGVTPPRRPAATTTTPRTPPPMPARAARVDAPRGGAGDPTGAPDSPPPTHDHPERLTAPPTVPTAPATPAPTMSAAPPPAVSGAPENERAERAVPLAGPGPRAALTAAVAPAEAGATGRPARGGRTRTARRGGAVRRRLAVRAALVLLPALLVVEGVIFSQRALAPTRPSAARSGTPRGEVKGVVAYAPTIVRFALTPGRLGAPATLSWRTRGGTRVTIDGRPEPARGTLAVRPSAQGSVYALEVANGRRRVTRRLRAVGPDPIALAATVPTALFNVTALRFGVGATGATAVRTIRLVNLGPAPLAVARVAIAGDRAHFRLEGGCVGQTLPVDGACPIRVGFRSGGHGARHAVLIVVDNTADSPHQIPLDGGGV